MWHFSAGIKQNRFNGYFCLVTWYCSCRSKSVCCFYITGRFTTNGWQAAEAVDMMTVYNSLPGADIQRSISSPSMHVV